MISVVKTPWGPIGTHADPIGTPLGTISTPGTPWDPTGTPQGGAWESIGALPGSPECFTRSLTRFTRSLLRSLPPWSGSRGLKSKVYNAPPLWLRGVAGMASVARCCWDGFCSKEMTSVVKKCLL